MNLDVLRKQSTCVIGGHNVPSGNKDEVPNFQITKGDFASYPEDITTARLMNRTVTPSSDILVMGEKF